MNDQTLSTVLGLLYTAANRRLGDAERIVWREALVDVRDDVALEAARTIVRETDLWDHPPTPALFRSVTRSIATRMDDSRALTEGRSRVTPPEEAKEHLARLREALADRTIVKRAP